MGAGLVVGLVYALAMAASSRPLQQLGQDSIVLNRRLFKLSRRGLNSGVLLDNLQVFYLNTYRQADRPLNVMGPMPAF